LHLDFPIKDRLSSSLDEGPHYYGPQSIKRRRKEKVSPIRADSSTTSPYPLQNGERTRGGSAFTGRSSIRPLTADAGYAIITGLSQTEPEQRSPFVSCSERKRELRRRRTRRKKVSILARKLQKATVSERAVIADKLRALTPGGEAIIARWELEKR